MTEIAPLGLAIDSSSAKTATAALDAFANAAAGAGAAADKLASTSTASSKATRSLMEAVTPAAGAANGLADAADHASKAHSGLSTQAMAAQHSIRSLVEALASGQPISMALGQQLNHLSYAATGPGGITEAFKQASAAILSLVSPTTLVAGSIAALGVGGALAFANLAKSAKAFEDVAHAVGDTTTNLHALQQAAAVKQIGGDDFTKAMERLGPAIYDAKNNMGSLGELLRANGMRATDFESTFGKIADLVKNARDDQQRLQILQQAGLPATMDWVRFMQQGAAGIKAAADQTVTFNEAAERNLVQKAREFDEAWAKVTTNMSNNFKKALLEMSNAWDQIHPPQWLVNMANGMASGASMGSAAGPVGMAVGGIVGGAAGVVRDQFPESASFNDRFGSFPNAGKPNTQNLAAAMGGKDPNATVTVDPNAAKNALALAQPRLGLLGQLPSTKKQEASKPDSDSKQKETPHDVADLRRAA